MTAKKKAISASFVVKVTFSNSKFKASNEFYKQNNKEINTVYFV